jgi:hypothetical protein
VKAPDLAIFIAGLAAALDDIGAQLILLEALNAP